MKRKQHVQDLESRQEPAGGLGGVRRHNGQAAFPVAKVADAMAGMPDLPPSLARGALPVVALALPAVVVAAGAQVAARAAVKAVRKWSNYRPPRWKLLKCPKPEAVSAQWARMRSGRDPLEALRFGALLLNVSQYVDCSSIYGRGKHIVARNPGLKGWLRENRPDISYVTAMSSRKLAQTTCRAIGLPEFLPLEWVMPGTEAEDATRELNPEQKVGMKLKRKESLHQLQTCRDKLVRMLEGADNVNRFNAALDVATHGHRHRVSVKIAGACSKAAAEQCLNRHLQMALETLQTLPPEQAIDRQESLIALLDDLNRQVESRRA